MTIKNLATLASAGLCLATVNVNAQDLTGSASIGIESEYIFRGVELAGESAQVSIEGQYGDSYVGIWSNEPLQKQYGSEIDIYGGYNYAINNDLTADFGATVYYYPDMNIGDDDTFEIFAGISAVNALATPSLYAFYDFDLETLTLEASASHSINLTENGALEIGAAAGWVDETAGESHYYYNVSTDYVYNVSETIKAAIGVRAGGNDDHRGPTGKEHNIWGGASISASF